MTVFSTISEPEAAAEAAADKPEKEGARMKMAAKFEKEDGNIIDELGSVFVMALIFALILAFAVYGRLVQTRLAIDNIAKEYLYEMEQEGGLTAAAQAAMVSDLSAMGVEINTSAPNGGWGDTVVGDDVQVPYGDEVILDCSMRFPNPLFQVFGHPTFVSEALNVEEMLEYSVYFKATSRW